ncbi:hypothetical protein HMN09_00483000 [Mycena chlorophos]|uniref:Uncharacterized protein n=1 Tax=Mycena chlorophos TaxID=658473 RepID=A0A8H6TF33_MYCCL|nr:hypothetical protein HMN09_00483000 [Mycena chlorophos]
MPPTPSPTYTAPPRLTTTSSTSTRCEDFGVDPQDVAPAQGATAGHKLRARASALEAEALCTRSGACYRRSSFLCVANNTSLAPIELCDDIPAPQHATRASALYAAYLRRLYDYAIRVAFATSGAFALRGSLLAYGRVGKKARVDEEGDAAIVSRVDTKTLVQRHCKRVDVDVTIGVYPGPSHPPLHPAPKLSQLARPCHAPSPT